jgi:hypothetical protein
MEVHASKASAVVVQRVPAAEADWFLEWQRGVTGAAEKFPGYRATDVYPPGDVKQDEWVIVLHFIDQQSLQNWLGSPVRDELVKKLGAKAGSFQVQMLQGGFGAWFLGLNRDGKGAPPGWKMVLTVVLALFPTVMLLSIFVGPFTAPMGFVFSMLVGNFMSVAILQWVIMPWLPRVLAPWLNAPRSAGLVWSLGGAALILAALVVLALLFRLVTSYGP